MAIDFNKPAIGDNYSTGYTQNIRDAITALGKMLEGETPSNTPTNAKKYDAASDLFQYWTGAAWAELPLAYLKLTGGGTVAGTVNFSGTLQMGGYTVWTSNSFDPATKANLSGAAFTGAVSTNGSNAITAGGRVEGNGGGGNGLGKITVSTGTPTGGAQGDLWFQY